MGSSYNSWWYYIDGATGKSLGKLPTPETPVAHNLAVSADGQLGILGSMSSPKNGKAGVAVIDVPNRKVLRYMTFSEMVRPLTINHDASLVYVERQRSHRLRDWRYPRPARCSSAWSFPATRGREKATATASG